MDTLLNAAKPSAHNEDAADREVIRKRSREKSYPLELLERKFLK